jgi:exopolyphosphatase / guanosine-5'-triphosphate,3'-diphosphate pyrophosphatase
MPEGAPVAAVDCGTNSTRLIVVDPAGRVLERAMHITRLGEGVDATHRLSAGAIERTSRVLRDYRRSIDANGAIRTRVVATSAARDAENAEDFMMAAETILGVRPEILSGAEEGRLSFAGATAHLPDSLAGTGPVLVTDIGGGSTELSVGERGGSSSGGRVVATRSIDIGCVRVTERFLHGDPPEPDELAAAKAEVEKEVIRARQELPPLNADSLLIGLAGTVSTLSSLVHKIRYYDRNQVHHSVLTGQDVAEWLDILASERSAERLVHDGMTEGREDVIVGGVLVLATVMSVFERARCLVSEDDILDGLAADLLAKGQSDGA